MTVLSDPVKTLAKIADFDGSGYLEVWTSIRDGGADGILTDTPVHVPITSTGITTPDLIPGPAFYRLKLGALRQSIEGRIVIPASGPARVMDVIAASILIPEDTPAQLIVQAVQSYLSANPPAGSELPEYLEQTALDASYAPLWQPSAAYAINAPVILPNGKPAVRTSAGTSRAQFDSTELALWTLTGGGLDKSTADTLYAPVFQPLTAYTAGQVVISPTGLPISRLANGTSRAAYDATEIALWTPVAATPAQVTPKLDKTEAATTYTPQAAVGYGSKKAFFNCGNTVDTIANTTGALFRIPVKVPVATTRWRVHWQNRFGKTRTSQTGVVNVLGFVFGDELMNADGTHSGQFTAAPASVGAAGTATDGAEYVGAWVTDPALQLKPYADHLVSYGLTCASGVVMCRSSNIVQYRNGASQAPQFNQQTIVPNSTATPFGEMWIEYEFVGANSVGLYVGDSLTDGTKNLLGQLGNYPNAHALRDAVCPIVLGNSGIKVDDYMNIPTTDYVYTKWGLGNGVVPDYAVVMAGINDIIFLGFTDVEIQNKLVAFWNRLRAFGIKRIYAITLPPAGATGAVETQRLNVNAWLRGKPAGLAGVFDGDRALKDATTAANLDATYNSGDGLHYSVAGYQKLADTIPALK
ncbi:MAG: SGNH/GDSL hydrolase family protein [Rhodococcus sp. (in: high G+C Gram-positive bacteria)]